MKDVINALIQALIEIHKDVKFILIFYLLFLGIPLLVVLEDTILPKLFERIKNGIRSKSKRNKIQVNNEKSTTKCKH